MSLHILPVEVCSLILQCLFTGKVVMLRNANQPSIENDCIASLLTVSRKFLDRNLVVEVMLNTAQVVIYKAKDLVENSRLSIRNPLHRIQYLQLGPFFNKDASDVNYTLASIRSVLPNLKHLHLDTTIKLPQPVLPGRQQEAPGNLKLFIRRSSVLYSHLAAAGWQLRFPKFAHESNLNRNRVSYLDQSSNTPQYGAATQQLDLTADYESGAIEKDRAESMLARAAFTSSDKTLQMCHSAWYTPRVCLSAWQTLIVAEATSLKFNLTINLPVTITGHSGCILISHTFEEGIFNTTDMCFRLFTDDFAICIPQLLPEDFATAAKEFGERKGWTGCSVSKEMKLR